MENPKPLFTPQLLLSAPRRSPGVPNPSGTTVLITTTSYSFQEHSQNTTLQALLVQTGEIVNLAINQSISHINWLDDERFVCLRSEKDGRTSLLYAAFSAMINSSGETTSFHTAGTINASVSSMKIAQLRHDRDDFAVVISAPACQDGSLNTPADAAQKTNATGRLYNGLFVRHWDRYEGPDKNSLWYGKLSIVRESQYELSHLTNLLAGTKMECPIRPFGGCDHFDIRKDRHLGYKRPRTESVLEYKMQGLHPTYRLLGTRGKFNRFLHTTDRCPRIRRRGCISSVRY
jgi:hypothetical protein